MNFDVGVVHRRQVLVVRDGGFVAFSHGRESPVRALRRGDKVTCYAPKADMNGTPVPAFVAHATVTGCAPYQRTIASGYAPRLRDAVFDEDVEVPDRSLLEQLGGGQFRLGADDVTQIAGAMPGATRG